MPSSREHSSSGNGTLRELGEFGLIAKVAADVSEHPSVVVGPGDDAAVVRAEGGDVVVSVDMFVEGVHFRRDWSTALEVGRKCAAASLADIVAMGAQPTAIVIGFAAPGELPSQWAVQCTTGLREEAASAGAVIVGGDVVAADRVTISVTALGDLRGGRMVRRSGAQVGDVVAVAGRLGWAAAGLAVLSRGFRSPKALVEAHRYPQPPYEAGTAAAKAGATAMIDVSDGLIAEASGVALAIDSASLEIAEPIATAAAAYNVDPREWVMTGGEDHAILATFPSGAPVPSGFVAIGRVEAGDPGVIVDGHRVGAHGGHEHFR